MLRTPVDWSTRGSCEARPWQRRNIDSTLCRVQGIKATLRKVCALSGVPFLLNRRVHDGPSHRASPISCPSLGGRAELGLLDKGQSSHSASGRNAACHLDPGIFKWRRFLALGFNQLWFSVLQANTWGRNVHNLSPAGVNRARTDGGSEVIPAILVKSRRFPKSFW